MSSMCVLDYKIGLDVILLNDLKSLNDDNECLIRFARITNGENIFKEYALTSKGRHRDILF